MEIPRQTMVIIGCIILLAILLSIVLVSLGIINIQSEMLSGALAPFRF